MAYSGPDERLKQLKRRLAKLISEADDCELIAKVAGEKARRLRAQAQKLMAEIVIDRGDSAREKSRRSRLPGRPAPDRGK